MAVAFWIRDTASSSRFLKMSKAAHLTSGVTSKAANGGHFKTGQRNVAWD
jgi:hypothetical protein